MSDFDIDGMAADGLASALEEEARRIKQKYNLDTVDIIGTGIDGGNMTRLYVGRIGNFYASFGAIKTRLIHIEHDSIGCGKDDGSDL